MRTCAGPTRPRPSSSSMTPSSPPCSTIARERLPDWWNSKPGSPSCADEGALRIRGRIAEVLSEPGLEILLHRRNRLQAWSEARLTRDVDMTLLTGFGNEEQFIRPLLERYPGRVPDAAEFAL